ncbi:hypothetical protein I545_2092 [Mycobacterium kansasii 662]|uniref:Uncharacterized protein n=2 Tax=Mycobacterium kansasii TaxID=1768 RepID=A0A1V3XLD0_MYCKA|nr:hypothetical protein I547_3937 [Mycobacterium kansasii 824]EUA19598.1 hypothetical protein I545_2092 [Mycobacterium kansasii 662]OOK79211.1 hypothetical protein BZL30_2181 [Mycobacterium kansasii]OOK80013.1 hypothetical protein BZL29_2177 [Mycobacterium kansasii]
MGDEPSKTRFRCVDQRWLSNASALGVWTASVGDGRKADPVRIGC